MFATETKKQPENEKKAPGYLLYIGDGILPNYMGIISETMK